MWQKLNHYKDTSRHRKLKLTSRNYVDMLLIDAVDCWTSRVSDSDSRSQASGPDSNQNSLVQVQEYEYLKKKFWGS